MTDRMKQYRFNSKLSEIDAMFMKTAIFVPGETIRLLPKGRLRVKGSVNGAHAP
jgi:hypothetical protein